MTIKTTPALLVVALFSSMLVGCVQSSFREEGDRQSNTGHYAEALVAYDKAIQESPTYAEAHYGRGRALLALQRPQEAESAFSQAATLLAPGNEELLADILDGQGQAIHDQGSAQYERLARFLAAQCKARNGLRDFLRQGNLLAASGDKDGAELAFKKAELRSWDHEDYIRVRTYMRISDFYVACDKKDTAVLYLQYAAYVNPAYPGVSERFRKLGIVPGPSQRREPPKPESK